MDRYRSGHNGPDSKSGSHVSGSWVRIPPCPPMKNTAVQTAVFFIAMDKRDSKRAGVNDSPVDCQSREPAFPQKRNPTLSAKIGSLF